MLKNLAARCLNSFRGVQSRLAYETRIRDVPSPDVDSKRNVLIITVDCLRNDRISRTGYHRETTPFIDSLDSYNPAIAAAPWTFSSVPSILTGMYPHNHGAAYSDDSIRNQDLSNPPNAVRDDVYTLAELLAASGYETRFDTAIGTAAIPISGRCKTTYRHHDVDAEKLLSVMQEWWNGTSGPKFGYVHLGDLHEPLQEPQMNYFGDVPDIEGIERWRFEQGTIDTPEFEDYRNAKELLYDTLVRYVDIEIERIWQQLEEHEETILIVTSDHGEEFWEFTEFEEEHFEDPRGNFGVGHGHALVPPVIEVPIATNLDSLALDDQLASLVDIVPTILRELDARGTLDFDGGPLQTGRDEPVVSTEVAYGPNQISVTEGDDHLIYVPESDTSILIDFERGTEWNDPDRIEELKTYLPANRETGSAVTLSGDVKEQLSDLGYAQ